MNLVILKGNVGGDPEFSDRGATDVVNFSIATTERWRDKDGEQQESTEWHRVVFFGKLAGVIADHVNKGDQLIVRGSIQTNKYTDKKTGEDRHSVQIRGDVFEFCGGSKDNQRKQRRNDDDNDRGRDRGRSRNNNRRNRDRDNNRDRDRARDTRNEFDDDIPF